MASSLRVASRSLLDSVPTRFFDRLAVVLACILAVQTYPALPARGGGRRGRGEAGVPFERTTSHLWDEFQARGRLNDTSVALTTRKLDLLTREYLRLVPREHTGEYSRFQYSTVFHCAPSMPPALTSSCMSWE